MTKIQSTVAFMVLLVMFLAITGPLGYIMINEMNVRKA